MRKNQKLIRALVGATPALPVFALAAFSATASATNLIYEPFNYTTGVDLLGERNTQTGTTAGTAVQTDTSVGNLWRRASATATTTAINIDSTAGSLTAPTGLLGSVGNELKITGIGNNDGGANRLAFQALTTGQLTSGTVYYSFLLRVDDLTGANNTAGDYFISLNNTANADTTADPSVHPGEMRARVDPADSSKFSLGMFTQHGNPSTVPQNDPGWFDGLAVGDTYFVVGAFDLGASNSTRLWVNPSADFYGAALAPTADRQDTIAGTNGTSIGSILMHQRIAPHLTLDELRVATTWAEVTPAVLLPVANGLFWDTNLATAGAGGTTPSGTWDGATSNWTTAPYGDAATQLWEADKVAVFSGGNDASGAYTITVSGTQSASGLVFQDGTATVTGGQVDLTGAATVEAGVGRTGTVNSIVGGSAGLTKTGVGHLVLGGANTYTGGTTINAGLLHLTATNAMPATGTVTVNSGTTLSVRAGGVGEWTASTDTATGGTIGSHIAGRGGQGLADQVVWKAGSTMGISTLNAPGGALTYSGVIGGFHTDTGTTNDVGLLKRGASTTLSLTANNTFSGRLAVENDGGIVALSGTNANAGQSMAIPTVSIGNAGGDNTILDGSRDTGVKILANDALPANSLIAFGSSITAGGFANNPSSLLQLYDVFAASGSSPTGPSFNQTVRGLTGGSGRVKIGLGTFTVNVPTGETYDYTGTLRTDDNGTNYGTVIKTGAGEQIWVSNNDLKGDFILQEGTVGMGIGGVFGAAADAGRLIIQGGALRAIAGSISPGVANVEIADDFSVIPGGTSGDADLQFLNSLVTLTTPNPTITVSLPSGDGQLIIAGKITQSSPGYGFTKAGPGTMIFIPQVFLPNDYTGVTTIQQGALRTNVGSRIGDGNSDVNLAGGELEYNVAPVGGAGSDRIQTISNPIDVTANSKIAFDTPSQNITDTSDPNGIQFVFSTNSLDWTSGTLTFQNQSTHASTTVTFRPRFTGSGFDYAGPVVIANGSATKKTVLESTNTTGTQTWSGDMTGDGSYYRGPGNGPSDRAFTVLGGNLVSLAGVTVADNAKITLAQSAGNNRVLKTGTLTIGSTNSQLDLTNNKAIVTGASVSAVSAQIASGRNNGTGIGTWDGTGIITSESNAQLAQNLTTLAAATAADAKGISGAQTASFGGQTVNPTDVLVMYTYNGDANLSGNVDADDYFQIDSNYNKSGTVFGYFNGDFNYDGLINGDDYVLIDAGFAGQGAAIPNAPAVSGVTAVPEPAGLSLLAIAAASLTRRRRRA